MQCHEGAEGAWSEAGAHWQLTTPLTAVPWRRQEEARAHEHAAWPPVEEEEDRLVVWWRQGEEEGEALSCRRLGAAAGFAQTWPGCGTRTHKASGYMSTHVKEWGWEEGGRG